MFKFFHSNGTITFNLYILIIFLCKVNSNTTLPMMIYILLRLTPPTECHLHSNIKIHFRPSRSRLKNMIIALNKCWSIHISLSQSDHNHTVYTSLNRALTQLRHLLNLLYYLILLVKYFFKQVTSCCQFNSFGRRWARLTVYSALTHTGKLEIRIGQIKYVKINVLQFHVDSVLIQHISHISSIRLTFNKIIKFKTLLCRYNLVCPTPQV